MFNLSIVGSITRCVTIYQKNRIKKERLVNCFFNTPTTVGKISRFYFNVLMFNEALIYIYTCIINYTIFTNRFGEMNPAH